MRKPRTIPFEAPAKEYRATVTARYAAQHLLREIRSNPTVNTHLIPSFIFAICSGLETQLNDIWIDYLFKRVGLNYRRFYQPLLRLSLTDRLRLVIPIISDFRFELNMSNPDVAAMIRLFELRNRLIHAKQHWRLVRVENERMTQITDIEVDPTDFHTQQGERSVTPAQLDGYMSLFNKLVPLLSGLPRRIRRKNFNPRDYFLSLNRHATTKRT